MKADNTTKDHNNNKHGSAAKKTTVPKVRLYVERPDDENWFVHVGHVTERGRWRTEPHAHPAYGQINFILRGGGVMNLEGSSVPFDGPCALLLPTECVHGLDYDVDVDRWVVTIDEVYLRQINAELREFSTLWSEPRLIPLAASTQTGIELYRLIGDLKREAESHAVGHIAGTKALLTTLLLLLVREANLGQAVADNETRNDFRVVDRFRKLVDQHYQANLTLQDYASMMAISPVQLRTACASAAGQSPTKIIHARIITEAKRNLIFGDMSVEQIAFDLGFADAAYFTRFFRREAGQTPSQFRVTARQQAEQGGALAQ
jgi:AraC family transcriptional regulator, transcriptional activator of pobA